MPNHIYNLALSSNLKVPFLNRLASHLIRNEQECQEIWNYIETNPLKWEDDKYYI